MTSGGGARMSMHQAKLWAGKPERAPLDEGAVDAWRVSELDLGRALAVPLEALDGLRALALSLLEAGKWARARDVVAGLVTLGHVHPVDALVVARASAELEETHFADAAAAHARRWLVAKGVTLAIDPTIATLRALVERVEADWAIDVKAEWDRQRRLAATVRSFECLIVALASPRAPEGGDANTPRASTRTDRAQGAAHARGKTADARDDRRTQAGARARTKDASNLARRDGARARGSASVRSPELDALARVALALEAAGASAAVNAFPRGALEAARVAARARPVIEPVPQDRSAARWIEASDLGARLRAASARAKDPVRFDARLARFVHLVDQACAAPSYCATRTGWHYPSTKALYLARCYEPEVVMASEERWEASAAAAERALASVAGAPDPESALERALVERFVLELGFDAARMRGARPNVDAVVELVDAELLIPLRALNETLLDLDGELTTPRDERRAQADALLTELLTGAPVRWDSVRSNSVPRDRLSAAGVAARCWGAKRGEPGRGFDAEPAAHYALLFPITEPPPARAGAQPSPKE